MVAVQERAMLVDECSQRIRRHFPSGVWRSLFQERTGQAQFGSAIRTLLCVECPGEGPITRNGVLAMLNRVAPRHGGVVDPCTAEHAFVSFRTPEAGLEMAVAVQRLLPKARLRTGLSVGLCRIAMCHADSQDFVLLLGEQREHVEGLAIRAAPGTLQMSPGFYQAVEEVIRRDLGSCVVMTEYDDEALTEASLTLPPDGNAEFSTFSGLGLT